MRHIRERLRNLADQIPRPDLDARDAHVYGGLALAALGGSQLSPPWTLVALGIVLAAMGIFAPRKGGA